MIVSGFLLSTSSTLTASFDDSFSLMPNRKLSDFSEFLVGARISKSGNAIRASGDIEASPIVVQPGATVEITIDSTVP